MLSLPDNRGERGKAHAVARLTGQRLGGIRRHPDFVAMPQHIGQHGAELAGALVTNQIGFGAGRTVVDDVQLSDAAMHDRAHPMGFGGQRWRAVDGVDVIIRLEAFITFEVRQLALVSEDEQVE